MFATNAFLISAPSTSLALIAFNRHMKETQFNWARSKEWKRNHRQAAGTGGEGGDRWKRNMEGAKTNNQRLQRPFNWAVLSLVGRFSLFYAGEMHVRLDSLSTVLKQATAAPVIHALQALCVCRFHTCSWGKVKRQHICEAHVYSVHVYSHPSVSLPSSHGDKWFLKSDFCTSEKSYF